MTTALAALLAMGLAAQTPDRIIGLLTLPDVFGRGACDRFQPRPVNLFAEPDAARLVGSIRVDAFWTFHEDGGCEGLRVSVHRTGTGSAGELPTREYEYEAPAAMVLERRGRWFRVRLPDGAAWIQASERDEFHPLDRLLPQRLTYLTSAWDGGLAASPGAARVGARQAGTSPEPHVRVVELRQVDDDLWVRVEVLSHSVCDPAVAEPVVTARGWLPAHTASGELTIWFFARGC